MRPYRVVFLGLLVLCGCKVTQTAQPVESERAYYEDISGHRPEVEVKERPTQTQEVTEPNGHLRAELDSVSQLIVNKNSGRRIEQGYTIQLYNGPNRQEATRTLGQIRIQFPDLKSSLSYYQPDFKVKTGAFLDRVEAYETYQQVKQIFSDALLVPEKIRFNYD